MTMWQLRQVVAAPGIKYKGVNFGRMYQVVVAEWLRR